MIYLELLCKFVGLFLIYGFFFIFVLFLLAGIITFTVVRAVGQSVGLWEEGVYSREVKGIPKEDKHEN